MPQFKSMKVVREEIKQTEEALVSYAYTNGWPTVKVWDKYAKRNGLMRFIQMRYRTHETWVDLGIRLGFALKKTDKAPTYTLEKCIAALYSCLEEKDFHYVTMENYDSWATGKNLPSSSYIKSQIGSKLWRATLQNFGIRQKKQLDMNNWTKQDCIKAVRNALKSGDKFNYTQRDYWRFQVRNKENPPISVLFYYFGLDWNYILNSTDK